MSCRLPPASSAGLAHGHRTDSTPSRSGTCQGGQLQRADCCAAPRTRWWTPSLRPPLRPTSRVCRALGHNHIFHAYVRGRRSTSFTSRTSSSLARRSAPRRRQLLPQLELAVPTRSRNSNVEIGRPKTAVDVAGETPTRRFSSPKTGNTSATAP